MSDVVAFKKDTPVIALMKGGQPTDPRAIRVVPGQFVNPLDKNDFIAQYWVGDVLGNPVPSAGTVIGGDATLRTDMANPAAGAALLAFKRASGITQSLADIMGRDAPHLFDFIPGANHSAIVARTSSYDAAADIQTAITQCFAGGGGLIGVPLGLIHSSGGLLGKAGVGFRGQGIGSIIRKTSGARLLEYDDAEAQSLAFINLALDTASLAEFDSTLFINDSTGAESNRVLVQGCFFFDSNGATATPGWNMNALVCRGINDLAVINNWGDYVQFKLAGSVYNSKRIVAFGNNLRRARDYAISCVVSAGATLRDVDIFGNPIVDPESGAIFVGIDGDTSTGCSTVNISVHHNPITLGPMFLSGNQAILGRWGDLLSENCSISNNPIDCSAAGVQPVTGIYSICHNSGPGHYRIENNPILGPVSSYGVDISGGKGKVAGNTCIKTRGFNIRDGADVQLDHNTVDGRGTNLGRYDVTDSNARGTGNRSLGVVNGSAQAAIRVTANNGKTVKINLARHSMPDADTNAIYEIVSGTGKIDAWYDGDFSGATNIFHAQVSKNARVRGPGGTFAPDTNSATAYTASLQDIGSYNRFNAATAVTFTIPPNSSVAFPLGTEIKFEQYGAGTVTVAAGAGVTIHSRGGLLATAGQYASCTLKKVLTDTWTLTGDRA